MSKLSEILEQARNLLQGEPLRAITYGGAVVVYIVAKALGSIPDQSLDQALLNAGAAVTIIVSFVESARRFVYSEPTVQAIATQAAVTGDDTIPAPPADEIA